MMFLSFGKKRDEKWSVKFTDFSNIYLLADDSIVYREITTPDDHTILQQSLQALAEWLRTWLMEFNIKKCAILSITRKKQPSKHEYTIFGELLGR